VWFMLDRLDVAFNDSSELEKNAIRALFRAYRDMRSHPRISLKIFLRTDIWKRVTEEGFSDMSGVGGRSEVTGLQPKRRNSHATRSESSRDEPVATQKDDRKRYRVNKSRVADWS
jgi:hypothetical protein